MYPMNETTFSQRRRNVDVPHNALKRDQVYPTADFFCNGVGTSLMISNPRDTFIS